MNEMDSRETDCSPPLKFSNPATQVELLLKGVETIFAWYSFREDGFDYDLEFYQSGCEQMDAGDDLTRVTRSQLDAFIGSLQRRHDLSQCQTGVVDISIAGQSFEVDGIFWTERGSMQDLQ